MRRVVLVLAILAGLALPTAAQASATGGPYVRVVHGVRISASSKARLAVLVRLAERRYAAGLLNLGGLLRGLAPRA
jgi:hypothetical protein